jgi:hypothetical protein
MSGWLQKAEDDAAFVEALASLVDEFSRERARTASYHRLKRENLRHVCFEYDS